MEYNIPLIGEIGLDFTPWYGAGKLKLEPQEGPQRQFISCMAGFSGEEPRDQDFPLIFYGGAK